MNVCETLHQHEPQPLAFFCSIITGRKKKTPAEENDERTDRSGRSGGTERAAVSPVCSTTVVLRWT